VIDLDNLVETITQAGYITVVEDGDLFFKVEGISHCLEVFETTKLMHACESPLAAHPA
jgi:hypothetical protein